MKHGIRKVDSLRIPGLKEQHTCQASCFIFFVWISLVLCQSLIVVCSRKEQGEKQVYAILPELDLYFFFFFLPSTSWSNFKLKPLLALPPSVLLWSALECELLSAIHHQCSSQYIFNPSLCELFYHPCSSGLRLKTMALST